uniref:AMP-binding enzyme C-terminal domain-containing protein n=1 Tax=Panagrolaimus sp. ES5 TaxID=591445 RepID=A0AC34F8V8_9BILA
MMCKFLSWQKLFSDVGVMNSDGSIEMLGRYKDAIIRCSYNCYPVEIEQFIVQHASVTDVSVIGVSDKINGEEVCAWIRLKKATSLTVNELVEFLENMVIRIGFNYKFE